MNSNPKLFWAEIKADYEEMEAETPEDDIVKCICVDSWKTDDPNEAGVVIAKVILTKTGDSGVVYIDNIARSNTQAQKVIKEVLQKIKK